MPKLQRLIVSALFALLVCSCQSDEQKIASHMSRGDQYREDKQWAEAVIEYKNVLQIEPNHAAAHWGLSQAYLNNKQARDGFWELRETVRLDPANLEAKVALAQMSVYAGDLEESLELADQVIAADPQKVEAYLVKAQALDQLKRPEEVLATLEIAVEIAPDNDAPLVLLANFHRRSGDRDKAEPIYRQRVEKNPSYATWSAVASFLSEDRERGAEAEPAWRKALELAEGEDRVLAYGQLAGFYFRLDRFDEAEAVLNEGVEKVEDKLDLIYLLARFHTLRGNTEQADALIEGATAAAPGEPRPYLVLSAYRGRKGDAAGALAAAEEAVRVAPDDDRALLRKAEVLVEMGYAAKDKEKIAEGRRIADEVLAAEPSNAGALFVKAKIALAEGNADEAVASLRKSVDARPDWAQTHFVLGTALALQNENTAARTELARALEIDASLSEAHQVLAQVHSRLGEHEYAIEEGRLFLREKPEADNVRVLVAQSLLRLNRVDEALKELESVPEEKRGGEIRYALGRIYLARGDLTRGRAEIEAALAALPGNPEILGTLLRLDQHEGRLEESRKRIDAALEASPGSAGLERLKGQVLLASGKGDEAEAAFRRAIELDPNDVQSYRLLASYYQMHGRLQDTLQTFESAVKVDPRSAPLHHFLAMLYESAGERQKAIEHYETAIRENPNLAEAKNNLAYLLAEAGENLERALDLAQEAKALLPNNPNAADTLGWVLHKRGVPSAAVTYLKEAESGFEDAIREAQGALAAQRGLDDAHLSLGTVRVHLAMAYEANGQKDEARAALERALADYDGFVAGRPPPAPAASEPAWVASARGMLKAL